MALCIVNAETLPPARLWQLAAALPAGAPVIVMIHGYRFSPASALHDPHRHILALEPDPDARRAVGWPSALGLTADGPEGLGVAFGWEARGHLRRAYAAAGLAGAELAALIDRLAIAARRPVSVIGHSLGVRVALAALMRVAPGALDRLVLLAGAEFRDRAEAAAASPSGHLARIINVTTRENDMFDFGFSLALRAGRGRALGQGLSLPRRNWTDLRIDDPASRAALTRLGYAIGGGARRACHWSPYLRQGVFALYRALLDGQLAPTALAEALPAAPASSRIWSLRPAGAGRPALHQSFSAGSA